MYKAYPNILKKQVCQKICIEKQSTSKIAKEYDIPLKTVEKWVTAFYRNPKVFDRSDDYYKKYLRERSLRYDNMSVDQLIAELKSRDNELEYLKTYLKCITSK